MSTCNFLISVCWSPCQTPNSLFCWCYTFNSKKSTGSKTLKLKIIRKVWCRCHQLNWPAHLKMILWTIKIWFKQRFKSRTSKFWFFLFVLHFKNRRVYRCRQLKLRWRWVELDQNDNVSRSCAQKLKLASNSDKSSIKTCSKLTVKINVKSNVKSPQETTGDRWSNCCEKYLNWRPKQN